MVVVAGAWLLLAVLVLAGWPRLNADPGWRGGVLLLVLSLSVAHQLLFATITDDAFVPFRYAQHIADGSGAVFNQGERVEGYSDFAWVVLIAWSKALFGLDIPASAAVLGVLCALGCVLLAYFLVNRIVARAAGDPARERPAFGVLAAVLTAGANGLAAYGPSGSATPFFVFGVLAVLTALAARRPVVAGVLVALAMMTRPGGLVLALLAGLWLVFEAARNRASWWAPAGFALGALVLVVPWTAWRVLYYGEPVPNAVVVKLGGPLGERLAGGWRYLAGFSLAHLAFLVLAGVALVLFARRSRGWRVHEANARSLVWLIFVVALGLSVAVVFAGGDGEPGYRLLAAVPPLLAVGAIAACGVRGAARGLPSPRPRRPLTERRWVPAAGLAVTGLSLAVSVHGDQFLPAIRDGRVRTAELAEIGAWLGDRLPSGSVVATYANGPLAYWAGRQLVVVDVLGLTDAHIARDGERVVTARGTVANDYDYVVNVRRPALAVTTADGYSAKQRCAVDPVYADRYQVATFRREGTSKWIAVYPRSEQAGAQIQALDADPRFVHVPCPA